MSDRILITDTHQHLVCPQQFPYAWTGEIPQLKNRSFQLDDYASASANAGISKTIFMETAVDEPYLQDEARFALELAHDPETPIAGVVANCRPEQETGFEAFVESILDDKLVGFRRILHVVPDAVSQTSCFAKNVRLLEKHGLTFDLCLLASQLPLAGALAAQCPNVQFVLDHCGNPDIASDAFAFWNAEIRKVAALPNIACKISGVVANCASKTVTANLLRPYVEHCLDCFGWDRVVWGGDWPVCLMTSTLHDWVAISRELVASEHPDHQAKLFYQNAERIYLLKPSVC